MSRFPPYLRRSLPAGNSGFSTQSIVEKYHLNTVCQESKCPNRLECYGQRTATFLALGKFCTRNCSFCEIGYSKTPPLPEADEPERIAQSVQELGLAHAVITMVTRDDLPDQGASHMAAILRAIRQTTPTTTVEVLTSDFSGDFDCLDRLLAEKPDIFNHNLETVRSFTPRIRHKAQYDRSLSVLRHARQSGCTLWVKSGLMVGLGESPEEVHASLHDLKNAGCDIVTIGQYLQPSPRKIRVHTFIAPEQFTKYEQWGKELGFSQVYCGPWVRSDYNAHQMIKRKQ